MNIVDIANYFSRNNSYIPKSSLSSELYVTDDLYNKTRELQNLTTRDYKERSINVYLAFDEIIVSDYALGDNQRVVSNEKISAQIVPYKGKLIKKIFINNKLVNEKYIEEKDVNKISKSIYLIANYHTHPLHVEKENKTWGFFSDVDLISFSNNKLLLSTGLITKSYWLLVKTNSYNPINIPNYIEKYRNLINDTNYSYEVLVDNIRSFGIEVYYSTGGKVYSKYV